MSAVVTPPEPAHLRDPESGGSVRLRALLLGLALVPVHTVWLMRVETELGAFGFNSTDVSLIYSSVTALVLLMAVNWGLRVWRNRRKGIASDALPEGAFRPAEFVLIYTVLTLSAAFAGSDLLQNLTPALVHPFWFATEENNWAARILPLIPTWFAPREERILAGYYTGSGGLSTLEIARAWLTPCLVWGGFLMVICWTLLCINTLLRRQWAESERLGFPVVQLPILMARKRDLGALLRDRMLVAGMLVPIVLETVNILHAVIPSVPYIPLGLTNIGALFTSRPWSALAVWPPLFISWFPFGIGLAFFLPLDLSFSSWFFYLLRRAVDVAANAFGWDQISGGPGYAAFPFIREQASGAWVGLFLLTVWTGRRQLWAVLRSAFSPPEAAGARQSEAAPAEGAPNPLNLPGQEGAPPPSAQDDEPMSPRLAVFGLAGGFAALVAFSVVAGMAAWVAILFFVIYFVLQVTMTRIRAQLGPPALELFFVNPEYLLVEVTGTRAIAPQSLAVLSYFFWFNRCYRCQPMAHQLECFQLARAVGAPLRAVSGWILIGAFTGIAVGLAALLDLYYDVGQASAKITTYRTGVGLEAFNRLDSWLQNPRGPDVLGISVAGGALGFTLVLGALRDRYLGFPLHPIGYAFAQCYAMEYFWFVFLVTWVVKFVLIRYGGVKAYRAALPFFLGLILGDCLMGFASGMLGWALDWHGSYRY